MSIGDRIRNLRLNASMTQTELENKIHTNGASANRIAISRWENNKAIPGIRQLICIADIFSTSLDYLVKGDTSGIIGEDERNIIESFRSDVHFKNAVLNLNRLSNEKIAMAERIVASIIDTENQS